MCVILRHKSIISCPMKYPTVLDFEGRKPYTAPASLGIDCRGGLLLAGSADPDEVRYGEEGGAGGNFGSEDINDEGDF